MTLSLEETRALDALIEAMPAMRAQQQAVDSAKSPVAELASQAEDGDLLAGLTGVPTSEWKARLMGLLSRKGELQTQFLRWAGGNPMDAAFVFLGTAAAAFYQAERTENPKIKTYTDAFYYIATCASVGYADIFAVTQSGKSIAALVMIVGPSLAARVLDTRGGS
jgi:hypothetical protein